jgi:hypothetical protein
MPNNFHKNIPNLKLISRTHHWKEMNRIEIMKLLTLFLSQGLHQKLDNELFFLEEHFGNAHIFGPVQWEEVSPSTQVSSFC